jgi:5-carboxyvanillate decarboxylase
MTSLWGFYGASPSRARDPEIIDRLLDLDDRRIADMDATGVDVAVHRR